MKILIATGLTGGHLFPALAIAEYLQKKVPQINLCFVANDKVKSKPFLFCLLKDKKVYFLKNNPLRKYFFVSFFLILVKNLWKSFIILKKEVPDLVLGFGSNLTFPVVLAASFFRVPIVLHEQNIKFGKANRFSAPFARNIALSFQETTQIDKAIWTGNILNESFVQVAAKRKNSFRDWKTHGKLNVLVVGGSQGAVFLNHSIAEVFREMAVQDLKRIHATVITGVQSFEETKETLCKINVAHQVIAYTENMASFYEKADLLIARAGAGTISESLAFGLPTIYIPYPYSFSHQKDNALYLQNKGAAYVIEQNENTKNILKEYLLKILHDPDNERLKKMHYQASQLSRTDGLEVLGEKIVQLVSC